jgi:hypothetical protein
MIDELYTYIHEMSAIIYRSLSSLCFYVCLYWSVTCSKCTMTNIKLRKFVKQVYFTGFLGAIYCRQTAKTWFPAVTPVAADSWQSFETFYSEIRKTNEEQTSETGCMLFSYL